MKNLIIRIRQALCNHHYANDVRYDVYTNKVSNHRVCIKCGKAS